MMAQNGIFIPDPIYRFLPLVYIVTGCLTFVYVSTIMAIISGVLLISAGVLVFMWRSAAKSERRRARRKAERSLERDSNSISLSLSTSSNREKQH